MLYRLFLIIHSLIFLVKKFICLLWSKMRFIVLFFNFFYMVFMLTVLFDLLSKETKVLQIIFSTKLSFVGGNHILFMLFPSKLFSFIFSWFFYFLTFLLKSKVSQVINIINILNILLPFLLSMVVYLERSLRSHEIWICLVVIWWWYLFTI